MTTRLLLPILLPFIAGLLALMFRGRMSRLLSGLALAVAAANLFIAASLFGRDLSCFASWLGFGIDFSLRLYNFSGFILFAFAGFAFLVTLYSLSFMRGKPHQGQFYAYLLITLSLVNGLALADNLVLLLFFWEGLLIVTFAFISIGHKQAFRTGIKAFVIMGVADLCMMIGAAMCWHISGTLAISKMSISTDSALGTAAFSLLAIGAISKAGAMPFHSWIPDAAQDAPLPFMAFMPASLDKLAGIYFLARICLDMFKLQPGSPLSLVLMTIGGLTINLAVMMALIQKDYKRLLSYHAISQTGYMIMGIGTCLPVGIIGGIFHMINHATYKSGLFLTAGSVEKQSGSTDLSKIGGLGIKMPVTFLCFIVLALSISGAPPFNGFFSKEMVYDAALERGKIFYLAAILGSFLTAVSFLKLGHCAFLGKRRAPLERIKEAPPLILVPMFVIATACVMMGLGNRFFVGKWLAPVLGSTTWHMPAVNPVLFTITVVVLFGALAHHLVMMKKTGEAIKAADDIRYAPVLGPVYSLAQKKYFDPYEWGMRLAGSGSRALMRLDRSIDWVYNAAIPRATNVISARISRAHSGYYALYIAWALAGAAAVAIFLLKG